MGRDDLMRCGHRMARAVSPWHAVAALGRASLMRRRRGAALWRACARRAPLRRPSGAPPAHLRRPSRLRSRAPRHRALAQDITEEELWGTEALRVAEEAARREGEAAKQAAKKVQKPPKAERKAQKAGAAAPAGLRRASSGYRSGV